MIRQIVKLSKWSVLLSVICLGALIVSTPFYLYERFDAEYPLVKLEFRQVAEQEYVAQLRTGDFCKMEEIKVFGDQWRVDASFAKWKGIAVTLGFEPLYRLDRISGRYRNVDDQNSKQTLAHDLSTEVWLDPFDTKHLLPDKNYLVETIFGSSVYLDVDPEKTYTVYMTEDALIAKSQDKPKIAYDNGIATIEINNACAKEPDLIAVLAKKINRLAIKLL